MLKITHISIKYTPFAAHFAILPRPAVRVSSISATKPMRIFVPSHDGFPGLAQYRAGNLGQPHLPLHRALL